MWKRSTPEAHPPDVEHDCQPVPLPTCWTTPHLPSLEDLIAHARTLAALGFGLTPTCFPTGPGRCVHHGECGRSAGKRPLRLGFVSAAAQLQTPDATEVLLRSCWPCNLALVVGAGFVVIEADSPAADQELIAPCGGVAPITPTRLGRPGRGRGFIFTCPPGSLTRATHRGKSGAIDVLPGGSIFVVPPSIHATGHRYCWAPGCAPWDAAPLPVPDGLLRLVQSRLGQRVDNQHPHPSVAADPHVAQLAARVRPVVTSEVARLIRCDLLVARLWRAEGKRHGDVSRSGLDFSLAQRLFRLRVPLLDIACALAYRPSSHANDPTYTARTALRASGASR